MIKLNMECLFANNPYSLAITLMLVFLGCCTVFTGTESFFGENLVSNPGFEEGTDGGPADWFTGPADETRRLEWTDDEARTGKRSLKIKVTGNPGFSVEWHSGNIPLTGEKTIRVRGWVKTLRIKNGQGTLHSARIIIRTARFGWIHLAEQEVCRVSGTSDWTLYEKIIKLPPETWAIQVYLALTNATGTVWFDDISVEQVMTSETAVPGRNSRSTIYLNGEWKFFDEDDSTLPAGKWEKVRIPGSVGRKRGWLRVNFRVPADWRDGRKVLLELKRPGHYTEIRVNGKTAAVLPGEESDSSLTYSLYQPAKVDVTGLIVPGTGNTVDIYQDVRKDPKVTHMYAGSTVELRKDVVLNCLPAVYVEDVFVTTSVRTMTIQAEITVKNSDKLAHTITVCPNVRNSRGEIELEFRAATACLKSGESRKFTVTDPWEKPVLWGYPPYGEPYLYYMSAEIRDTGGCIDRQYTRFGFREFWAENTKFYLNGKEIFLMCADLSGAPANRTEAIHYIRALRGANFNVHRGSGAESDTDSIFYDTADELGFLVRPAVYLRYPDDFHLHAEAKKKGAGFVDISPGWIKENRNHPGIIMWTADNELCTQAKPYMAEDITETDRNTWKLLREFADRIKELDPSRPLIHQGDVQMEIAPLSGADYRQEILSVHPYCHPITEELNIFLRRYGYRHDKPLYVTETYDDIIDRRLRQYDFSFVKAEPAATHVFYRTLGRYFHDTTVDLYRMGAAGVGHITGGSVFYGTESYTDTATPWNLSSNALIEVIWPSLSGRGVRQEKTAVFPLAPHIPNWFDGNEQVCYPSVTREYLRNAFREINGGQDMAKLPEKIRPEIIVLVAENGRPLCNQLVFISPAEGQPQNTTGVLTDSGGTAWFIPEGPGKYNVSADIDGGRNLSRVIEVSETFMPDKAGYDYIQWFLLGEGTELLKKKQEAIHQGAKIIEQNKPGYSAWHPRPAPDGDAFSPDENGYIRHWLLCGPFPNEGDLKRGFTGYATDYLQKYGGEKNIKPLAGISYQVTFPPSDYWKAGQYRIYWRKYESPAGRVDLSEQLKPEAGILLFQRFLLNYAAAYIYSPGAREVTLQVCLYDGYKIYLNNRLIGENPIHSGMTTRPDDYCNFEEKVHLKKGKNLLLLKVGQYLGANDFYVRFLNKNNIPVRDLVIRYE